MVIDVGADHVSALVKIVIYEASATRAATWARPYPDKNDDL